MRSLSQTHILIYNYCLTDEVSPALAGKVSFTLIFDIIIFIDFTVHHCTLACARRGVLVFANTGLFIQAGYGWEIEESIEKLEKN